MCAAAGGQSPGRDSGSFGLVPPVGCSLAGVPAGPSLGRCRGGGEGAAMGAPDPDRGALLVPRGPPCARPGPPHQSRWGGGPLHQPERGRGAGCFRAGSLRREWHTRPSGPEGRKRRTLGAPVRLRSPWVPSSPDPTCRQQQKRGVPGAPWVARSPAQPLRKEVLPLPGGYRQGRRKAGVGAGRGLSSRGWSHRPGTHAGRPLALDTSGKA